jgi:Tfp pilus assembly protein PilV
MLVLGVGAADGGSRSPLSRIMSRPRGDEGLSLIECIVAIALLVIILAPTTLFVIEGNRFSAGAHLEAEANTLATQALEGLQAEATQGALPGGFQSSTQNVDEINGRTTIFTISTTWTTITQGTNQSLCTNNAGVTQQIWLATASVSWNNMQGAKPVTQTTEIAPGQAGAFQESAGELAVALSLDGTLTNLFLGQNVRASVTGIWTGSGSARAVPSGQRITARARSAPSRGAAPTGCLIFSNLDPQYTYTLSFAGNPTIVSGQEYSDSNPNGPLTVQNINLQAGVPFVLIEQIDNGTTVAIKDVSPAAACTSNTAPAAPVTTSPIPVSVNNTSLTYPVHTWVASGGTTPFNSLLLFPYSTLTQIWAGDGANGNQATYGGTPCTVVTAVSTSVIADLPVYPLTFTYTGSPAALTATEVGGSAFAYSLAFAGGTSATSIPLGEYNLSYDGGAVTILSVPVVVWVTPSGECISTTGTLPPAAGTCHLATIGPVTA